MRRRSFLKTTLAAIALAMSGVSLSLRSAVADICSKIKPPRRTMKLPPVPKWKKMTDDIDSMDFYRCLNDYERSLLPPDLVFPRKGQIWESMHDCEVHVVKPMTGSNGLLFLPNVRLRKGEKVRILVPDAPKPLQIRFQSVRSQDGPGRTASTGLNYEFWLRTAPTVPVLGEKTGYFNELFRLIEDVV